MSQKDIHPSGRGDRPGGRFRLGVNRMEVLTFRNELDEVNKKSLISIATSRQEKKEEPLPESENFKKKVAGEFRPTRFYEKRKTKPVIHGDMPDAVPKDKSPERNVKYNPLDKEDKLKDMDKTKKFPFSREVTITAEDMRKPHVTSVGIVPVRESQEVQDLKVLMGGKKALPSEDPVLGPIERANIAPELEALTDRPWSEMLTISSEPTEYKPAILGATGTTQTVSLAERPAPPKKPRTHLRVRLKSAARSEQSEASSFKSMEIQLPTERGTHSPGSGRRQAGSKARSKSAQSEGQASTASSTLSVKSAKDLLEEAQQIASPGGEKLLAQERRRAKEDKNKDKRKSSKSSKSSKTEQKPEIMEEPKKSTRTVDEIIASLKDPTVVKVSDADRKIQEIMERVLTHSRTVLGDQAVDVDSEDADEENEEKGDEEEEEEEKVEDIMMDTERESIGKSQSSHTTIASVYSAKDILDIRETEEEPIDESGPSGEAVPSNQSIIMQEALEKIAEAEKEKETAAPEPKEQAEKPAEEKLEEEVSDTESMESDEGMDLKQAWEDYLAPSTVAYEDIVSIKATVSELHKRPDAKPTTDNKDSVPPKEGFLTSWSAVEGGGGGGAGRNSIHHFCRQREDVQLPDHLRGVWRRYHVPSKYDHIQKAVKELESRADSGASRSKEGTPASRASFYERERLERQQSAAARKILGDASQLASEENTDALSAWQKKAHDVFDVEGMEVAGEKVIPKTDESFMYWTPAPPKWNVAPVKVKEQLFPSYHGAALGMENMEAQALTEDEDDDSEIEELAKEDTEDTQDRQAKDKVLSRTYGSARDLTALSKARMSKEMVEEQGSFTGSTVSLLPEDIQSQQPEAPVGLRSVSPVLRSRAETRASERGETPSEASSIALPTKQVGGTFRVTNIHCSSEMTKKNTPACVEMRQKMQNILAPILSEKLGENFKDIIDIDFRPGSLIVRYKANVAFDAPEDIGAMIQRAIRNAVGEGQLADLKIDPLSVNMHGDSQMMSPAKGEKSFSHLHHLPKPPEEGQHSTNIPVITQRKRRDSAPGGLNEDDETLLIYQDYSIAMTEILKQREQLRNKAKQAAKEEKEAEEQRENAEQGEVETIEAEHRDETLAKVEEEAKLTKFQMLAAQQLTDEPTRAELALEAGRSYVLLPRKKKKVPTATLR